MDDDRLAQAEREIDELGWRVTILEHALKEAMAHLCAQDDLLAKRFTANVEDMLKFIDRVEARHGDPDRTPNWPDKREFIADLAEALLPAKHRIALPPSAP